MTASLEDMRRNLAAAAAALPTNGDPQSEVELLGLLRALYAAGRRDLPLGRLLEGHVDAVQIALRYGSSEQVDAFRLALSSGALVGVWNADLPEAPLRLKGELLAGGKSFASGAGVLTHALVTAATGEGAQLLLIDLAAHAPEIDTQWWRVVGMQRSETHRVSWSNAPVEASARIGAPGDYAREPWFSGGALRFTAVQAGGVAAVFDATRNHLTSAARAGEPFQSARLADLLICGERAACAVRRAARMMFADVAPDGRLAAVAAARVDVAEAAERALTVAQQAVGLQGLFIGHPLARVVTDLAVYLRQPAPDAQRLRVGAAVVAGLLAPAL